MPNRRPHNRAAQDTTLVNLRAMKKRVELLERQMADRTRRIDKNERGGMMNQAAIEIANKDIGKVAHALIALRNHEAVNALAIAKLREELLPRVR